jgi:hypothetical protein
MVQVWLVAAPKEAELKRTGAAIGLDDVSYYLAAYTARVAVVPSVIDDKQWLRPNNKGPVTQASLWKQGPRRHISGLCPLKLPRHEPAGLR